MISQEENLEIRPRDEMRQDKHFFEDVAMKINSDIDKTAQEEYCRYMTHFSDLNSEYSIFPQKLCRKVPIYNKQRLQLKYNKALLNAQLMRNVSLQESKEYPRTTNWKLMFEPFRDRLGG